MLRFGARPSLGAKAEIVGRARGFSRAEKNVFFICHSEPSEDPASFMNRREKRIPRRCVSGNDKRRDRKLGCDGAYSTISKRYSSMTGLVSTSLEIFSSCCCASSRDQPSRFSTKNFPCRTSVIAA